MLTDQRRKRGRQALVAMARAPSTMRRPNALRTASLPPSPSLSPPPQSQSGRSAESRILAALPRFSDVQPPPHYPRQQQPLWTRRSAMTTAAAAAVLPPAAAATAAMPAGDSAALLVPRPTPATDLVDVRKLIRHAHRAHKLLLDRLTVVNMRRNHRCELANEIARLKRVLTALQAQVDTTTRNVAAMDRLVQHLQQISSIFDDGTTEQRRSERIASADCEALVVAVDTPQTIKRSRDDDTADTSSALAASRLERTESSCSKDEKEAEDQGRASGDSESTASAPSPTDTADDSRCVDECSSTSARGDDDATWGV